MQKPATDRRHPRRRGAPQRYDAALPVLLVTREMHDAISDLAERGHRQRSFEVRRALAHWIAIHRDGGDGTPGSAPLADATSAQAGADNGSGTA